MGKKKRREDSAERKDKKSGETGADLGLNIHQRFVTSLEGKEKKGEKKGCLSHGWAAKGANSRR